MKNAKAEVMIRCSGTCEVIGCDADANTVHHLIKASTFPELKNDPRVMVGMCGRCHTEIERRMRCGEPYKQMIPDSAWKKAEEALAEYIAGQMGGD